MASLNALSNVAATNAQPAVKAPLLSIRKVAKAFGSNVVLRDISLDIAEGEFLTILGESGSGKTTLLRIIAGFESATSGEVWMGSERLDLQPPYRRRVNTVFQHYALFPHLTVEQNVGYGLRVARRPQAEITQRVAEALERSDHGYVLETGHIVLEGRYETLVADDRVRRSYLGLTEA